MKAVLFSLVAASDISDQFVQELHRVTWTFLIPALILALIAGVAFKTFERWSIREIRSSVEQGRQARLQERVGENITDRDK